MCASIFSIEYRYDVVGNIEQIAHRTKRANGSRGPGSTQWTRRYRYATDSNQLLATSIPGDASHDFSERYAASVAASGAELTAIVTGSAAASTTAAVTGSFALGYGAGRLLDEGVGLATGESLSSRGARRLTAVDQAVSSVLPPDNSLPEYKQENRIAWWLIDAFGL